MLLRTAAELPLTCLLNGGNAVVRVEQGGALFAIQVPPFQIVQRF